MTAEGLLGKLLRIVSPCLFAVLVSLPSHTQASDLHEYVRQYQSSRLSADAINKVKRYDHLIDYFTRFSYFRPMHRVSPDFVRALILAESGANPRAVSSKGALGLGQIMLATGQEAGRDLAQSKTHFRHVSNRILNNITREDLFDPAVNILLTCYLIAKYNYKFDGKLELVLSAWNAGVNTSSLNAGKHAPYRETKALIGKVNGYYLYLLKQKGTLDD